MHALFFPQMNRKLSLLFALSLAFVRVTSLYGAESVNQANASLTLSQRLERQHLQATHEARLRLAQERHPVPVNGLYEDYRAVLLTAPADPQSAKPTPAEILAAAHKAGVSIVMTATETGAAGQSSRGLQEGVLFIPCTQTSEAISFAANAAEGPAGGRFLTGAPGISNIESVAGIILNDTDTDPNAGPKSYLVAVTKDPRRWTQVLETYRAFPDEFFGAGGSYRQDILANWDRATGKNPLTAIGGSSASPNLTLEGAVFNPCEISFRSLVTHILARALTEASIHEALTNGHAYVAHDWLCDPSGFSFGAVNNLGVFTMGDPAPMLGKTRITALTPVSAKLRLIHDGAVVKETASTNLTFEAAESGAYRLEAWLNIDGEERPWIYSNPVYLKKPGPRDIRLPSTEISAGVERRKDIVYRDGAEEDAGKHKLDIYVPKEKSNTPVLFFIHGGSWRSGDRSNYPPLGNRFAREGFVTVVPSYRLAPKHPHPAQIEDVAAAFAWTVRHIAEYGGDTNRIYVAGHSAGGHLAALLSLDEHYLAAHQLSPKSIHGVLALSGVYDLASSESQESVFGKDPQVRRDASPLFHIRPDAPPFLVTYCQWDYFSLPAQARKFYRALAQAGVKSELVYVPGENHISEIVHVCDNGDPTASAALRFMQ